MKIYIDQKLVIEGISSALINPVIVMYLVHCRALL